MFKSYDHKRIWLHKTSSNYFTQKVIWNYILHVANKVWKKQIAYWRACYISVFSTRKLTRDDSAGEVLIHNKGTGYTWHIFHQFKRETSFLTLCLSFLTPIPFWNRVYSKRKEFAPFGSKFFPLRVDPFSEGRQTGFVRFVSSECEPFSLKNHDLPCVCLKYLAVIWPKLIQDFRLLFLFVTFVILQPLK